IGWPKQIADDELQSLAGALRQQNLARVGADAKAGQHKYEMLAQREVAERVPVVQQIGAVLAREHVEALANSGFIEPRIRQPRATRKKRVLIRLQQSPNEPDQLLVAFVVV